MPAALAAAIQGILALLTAAPQITALAVQAKEFFTGLFNAGLITKELQDALHAHVDSTGALWKAGMPIPPEFQVEPDPAAPAN